MLESQWRVCYNNSGKNYKEGDGFNSIMLYHYASQPCILHRPLANDFKNYHSHNLNVYNIGINSFYLYSSYETKSHNKIINVDSLILKPILIHSTRHFSSFQHPTCKTNNCLRAWHLKQRTWVQILPLPPSFQRAGESGKLLNQCKPQFLHL